MSDAIKITRTDAWVEIEPNRPDRPNAFNEELHLALRAALEQAANARAVLLTGAGLTLACEIVLAAQSAKFIQSFVKAGLIPDTGGSWHLPRLMGEASAKGLALTKDAIRKAAANARDAHLELETGYMKTCGESAEYGEGVSALLAKRPAKIEGR